MVDVDCRTPPSFSAGLRRLSARASTTTTTTIPRATTSLHSFTTFATSLLSTLNTNNIPLSPGLSEAELSRIESLFNFSFPPDLRSLLALRVPSSSAGFPDWRALSSLPSLFHLPTTSFLLHLSAAANSLVWPTSLWGARPADNDLVLSSARNNLRRVPILIPLFGRCYIPSRPALAGNPIFYVDDIRIFCCAIDLRDFFSKGLFGCGGAEPLPTPTDRVPRWIEFWTDAASLHRRRRSRSGRLSSCSSVDSGPDPERYVEIRNPKGVPPGWVEKYMDGIGAALRDGGWEEEEVEEMVHVSGSCWIGGGCEEGEVGLMVMDVMAMRAERWGEELRRAGWSSEEVADALGLGMEMRKESTTSKRMVKLPSGIRMKVEKLAQEFNKY